MKIYTIVILVIAGTLLFAEDEKQFANLGGFQLENGQVIKNNYGHLAIGCEMDRCIEIINQFFNK